MIAKHKIHRGDEITISYIDTNLPVVTRQDLLLRAYYFRCQCDRCSRELSKGTKGRSKITYQRSYLRKPKEKKG